MKKVLGILGLSILASCARIEPGYVGVKVDTWGTSEKGSMEQVGPGRYVSGMGTEFYRFPIFVQNKVWTKDKNEGSPVDQSITIQTVEGLGVNLDVGLSFQIDKNKALNIFRKYRKGIDDIADTFLRNHVRDAFVSEASELKMVELYGKGKNELLRQVEKTVRDQVEETGIIVDRIYIIGEMRFPDSVKRALNAKIEAGQKAEQRETELREAEAEARKKLAKSEGEAKAILLKAKAEAEANKVISNSLDNRILMNRFIEKWDGKLPTTMAGETVDLLQQLK